MTDQPTKGPFEILKAINGSFSVAVRNIDADRQTIPVAMFYDEHGEANAALFIRAQHMDELVEAVEVCAADSRWVSGEPEFERLRTILAKIKGEK